MKKVSNIDEDGKPAEKPAYSLTEWKRFEEEVLALQERMRGLDPECDRAAMKTARNDLWILLWEKKHRRVMMSFARNSKVYFGKGIEFEDVLMEISDEISHKYDPNKPLLNYIKYIFGKRPKDTLRKEKEKDSLDTEDLNGISGIDKVRSNAYGSDPEKENTKIEEWNRIFLKFAAMVLNYSRRTKKGDQTRFRYFEKFYTGDLIMGAAISEDILLHKYTRELLLAASVPFVNHVDRFGNSYDESRKLVAKDICEIYLKSEEDASWIPGEGDRPVSGPTDPPLKLPVKNGVYRGYFAQVENKVIAPAIISQQLAGYGEQKDEWRRAVENDNKQQLLEDLSNFKGQ